MISVYIILTIISLYFVYKYNENDIVRYSSFLVLPGLFYVFRLLSLETLIYGPLVLNFNTENIQIFLALSIVLGMVKTNNFEKLLFLPMLFMSSLAAAMLYFFLVELILKKNTKLLVIAGFFIIASLNYNELAIQTCFKVVSLFVLIRYMKDSFANSKSNLYRLLSYLLILSHFNFYINNQFIVILISSISLMVLISRFLERDLNYIDMFSLLPLLITTVDVSYLIIFSLLIININKNIWTMIFTLITSLLIFSRELSWAVYVTPIIILLKYMLEVFEYRNYEKDFKLDCLYIVSVFAVLIYPFNFEFNYLRTLLVLGVIGFILQMKIYLNERNSKYLYHIIRRVKSYGSFLTLPLKFKIEMKSPIKRVEITTSEHMNIDISDSTVFVLKIVLLLFILLMLFANGAWI
jgi:hypothetical protein